MRTMYDAVTARNIPTTAAMVAGYIDKIRLEPWSAADWARFPTAVKVTIVKKASTNAGHVLDVEPGDATPAEAPGWVRMRRAAGADPTVYMNASTWPTVRQAFTDQGVAQPHYWVAKYDGNPKWADGWAELGCVAKQYAGDLPPGIDLSSVADYWPGVDPAPGGPGGPAVTTIEGVELMERKHVVPPNAEQNTVRVYLSGTANAGVIIRPKLDGNGFSAPMWVGNIYAWGNDRQGVGHNPNVAGYNPKLTSHRRFDLPGAVWADIEYSAAPANEFDVDCF